MTKSTLQQKIRNLDNAEWQGNTNLQAVFDLILNTATRNMVSEKDMPKKIYIISDMEFDEATSDSYYGRCHDKTNFEVIKKKYKNAGYEMPQLVFWNVNSKQNNVPVKYNEDGVALVSGCSPSIFKYVMEGTTPEMFMHQVLDSNRYNLIEEALN